MSPAGVAVPAQAKQPGRRFRGRAARWGRLALKWLLLLLGLGVGGGTAYQWTVGQREARLYPPPGRLVGVGGYRLHINCTGEGGPAVIFEAGLGDTSVTWDTVQPEIAKFTRVCSYDRAGYGWSDPPQEARTSENIAKELERLLTNAGVAGPYVLVGHSFGGFNVRVFAAQYPRQVAGIVLVDSSYPFQDDRFPASARTESYYSHLEAGIVTMSFGLPRLIGWCRDDYTFPNQPASWFRLAPKAIALDCRVREWRTMLAELKLFRENSSDVANTGSLGDKPLVVLSHDPHVGAGFPPGDAAAAERAWTEMQQQLTHLSSDSRRIVAKGSGHYIQVYRPDLVIGAIRDVVTSVHEHKPLAGPSDTLR